MDQCISTNDSSMVGVPFTGTLDRGNGYFWELLFFKEVWTNALHRFAETIVTPASIGYTISNAQSKKAACPL